MSAINNSTKKYPIIPKQVITEREQCPFTMINNDKKQSSKDNTEKCSLCGSCSTNYINGLLLGLYEVTLKPIALIERIDCKQVTFDIVNADQEIFRDKGYLTDGDKVYHIINASTSSIKVQSGSICYKMRSENDWLDIKCNRCDMGKVNEVLNAIDIDKEGYFKVFPDELHKNNEEHEFDFEYYDYKCPLSLLTEVVVPIYYKEQNALIQKRSKMGFIGLLIIGQLPIGDIPENNEMIKNIPPDTNDAERDVIVKLRKDVWKKAEKDKNIRASVQDVLSESIKAQGKSIGKEINVFLEQMRNSVTIRENDYLSVYQSKLISAFLKSRIKMNSSKDEDSGDSIKQRIIDMFSHIYKDFSISAMYLFFSDLKLSDNSFNPELAGFRIGDTTELASIQIDISKFSSSNSYKADMKMLKENRCLIWKRLNNNRIELVELDDKSIEDGYYEFYAAMSGLDDTRTFFGVFMEWEVLPPERGTDVFTHLDFFTALIGVCTTEIMDCVNLNRIRRLKAFTEDTRHDLAQRLQTLDSHNNSFKIDCMNFESCDFLSSNVRAVFAYKCSKYLQANRELHNALNFLKQSLDDTDLRYRFDPKYFNPYIEFFSQLRQHYNASWHPLNRRRKLIIGPYVDKEPLQRIYADEAMFRRIMMNLIDNAFKYSPEETNILLRYRYDINEQKHIFDVMNFSYGITEEISGKIFDRGVRGNHAAKGDGLGLSVALGFAKRHRGDIMISTGIIPKLQNSDQSRASGFISKLDITCYYILKDLSEQAIPRQEVLDMWERVSSEVEQLCNAPPSDIYPLVDLFGRRNTFDLMMTDQPENDRRRIKPKIGLRDLRDRVGRSIYLTTFSLILPDERRPIYESTKS